MQECRLYRGIVEGLQHLSIDRCEVQFETNACAKEMKQKTKASWTRLKRLARYLAGTQSARVVLKPGTDHDPHGAFCETVKDRKSQPRLTIEVDGCPLYSVSRKQKARAHSGGEAEYYAAASATSEAMYLRSLVIHWTGSPFRTLAGHCSRTWHMQTRRCWNHTSFVNESFFGYSS